MNRLRVALALGGFALALLSIALDNAILGWAAIALLAGSVVARLILRKRKKTNSPGGPPV